MRRVVWLLGRGPDGLSAARSDPVDKIRVDKCMTADDGAVALSGATFVGPLPLQRVEASGFPIGPSAYLSAAAAKLKRGAPATSEATSRFCSARRPPPAIDFLSNSRHPHCALSWVSLSKLCSRMGSCWVSSA